MLTIFVTENQKYSLLVEPGWAINITGRAEPRIVNGVVDGLIVSMLRYPDCESAKLAAEAVFGLLDWGKGGQAKTQAKIALEP
jgi:hypothetical protein